MFAHRWLGYQGVACHELYLEKFGVKQPVFSTALAFNGYKGSNLSLTGLGWATPAFAGCYDQNTSKMNSGVPVIRTTSPLR